MTYEEKLQKVVGKLKEERDLTRKNHKTKVVFDDSSFTKLRIGDVCKIILKLRDDEGVVKILDSLQPIETVPTEQIINPSDNDDLEGVEVIMVEIDEAFDEWYRNYLIKQKGLPENLDNINLHKVLDVCIDINQQLQISGFTTVLIPSLPYPNLFRFPDLFPFDNVGTRKNYQQYRWESAQYLLKQGVVLEVEPKMNDVLDYGNIQIKVDMLKFEDFYKKIREEYIRRNKSKEIPENSTVASAKVDRTIGNKIAWHEDFKWKGKDFVFGNYGNINFSSDDTPKKIFLMLSEAKGNWVAIVNIGKEIKKDANHIRSTIGQIRKRLPKNISIPSTRDDNLEPKPSEGGAYRIKFNPEP